MFILLLTKNVEMSIMCVDKEYNSIGGWYGNCIKFAK